MEYGGTIAKVPMVLPFWHSQPTSSSIIPIQSWRGNCPLYFRLPALQIMQLFIDFLPQLTTQKSSKDKML
jgi:hypothetical protein